MNILNKKSENLKQGAIRSMFDKAKKMKDVISLGIGEPDLDTDKAICNAASAALNAGETHYTQNAGTLACRTAVSRHSSIKELNYDPETEIIITPGGMGALSLFLLVCLNEGDEVLIQNPQWLNYKSQIELFGGKAVPIPTKAQSGFVLEAHEVEKLITPRTKILMINSPNNPTGCLMTRKTLIEIADVVKKHDLFVVSDEVYNTLCYEDSFESISSLPGMKKRTLVVNSLSKAFAMTGWRLGYAAGPADIILKMTQAQENISACANAPAQAAAIYAYEHPEISEQIRSIFERRRSIILSALDKIEDLNYCIPYGGFYVFPDIHNFGLSSEVFCERLLEEEHLVCIPGNAFGSCGEGYIRMSYTCSESDLREALNRFAHFCHSLRGGLK